MGETSRTLKMYEYDREKAVEYAHTWAYKRNPVFLDFENFGGDCTNFASQVIFAGSGVMNYTPIYGWYYIDANNRAPAWTGVDYLYNFLVNNRGSGPFAEKTGIRNIKPGDILQLSFNGGNHYNHSPVIIQTGYPPDIDNILVATHTDDQDNYPLSGYQWKEIRFIHIIGVRKS
ncbi:MAG: amidase domain-containing protein [Clostridiales bacterium]|nr:amidase domain-containing protein [Eubacteriales bacterium]MDH7565445.1 amidase domain-containing protein [Clostridiales bacterium]